MESRQLAGRVTRWHTWPMIRKPSVMEHAGRVASLYCELWGIPRGEVLCYCLHHDHGEQTAGDTPFSAKGLVPELRENLNKAEELGRLRLRIALPELSREEFARFKVCDLLEMYETGVVEWNMGNRYAGCVIVDCAQEAMKLAARIDVIVGEDYTHPRTYCQTFVRNWLHNNDYRGEHAYDAS